MNYTTTVFLINDDVRAVACTYEAEDGAKRKTFKTFDHTITIGDFVVVPTETRHKMTVCKVVDVDVDVDFDGTEVIGWIVQKVDVASYQATLSQEAQSMAAIRSAEKTKKRNDLRDAILANVADLKALPMASGAEAPEA